MIWVSKNVGDAPAAFGVARATMFSGPALPSACRPWNLAMFGGGAIVMARPKAVAVVFVSTAWMWVASSDVAR